MEDKAAFPRLFPIHIAPRDGRHLTAFHMGEAFKVQWVRDSRLKDGGSFFDGERYYPLNHFQGWSA